MKVLHLQKISGVGGSERHLLTLLPGLRERGVDARFLGFDVGRSDASRFYLGLQAPAAHVRCGADVSLRLAVDVVRAARTEAPDLLHTHLVHADVYGAIASRALGIPVVSTRHNDDPYRRGPFRYVDRAFAAGAARIVAISHAVRRFLIETAGLPAWKIATIHYGLDRLPEAPSEIPPPEARPLVLAVGRLTAQKDHATALRAFADVRRHHPSAVFAVLGAGPLEANTKALAVELGLDGAVVFPGHIEPRAWLDAADAFVHSSRWEGFGMVLLEAMLAGVPVLATRVSAVPEVVGKAGILVPPGDAGALARELHRLLGDPCRARALGSAGRARAQQRFSVARMAERTIALYESVLARGTSAAKLTSSSSDAGGA